eukprot:2633939-Amphidinium_carterae.1
MSLEVKSPPSRRLGHAALLSQDHAPPSQRTVIPQRQQPQNTVTATSTVSKPRRRLKTSSKAGAL